jgi:ABC-type multidrug transport system fused ATPase/permease subunit
MVLVNLAIVWLMSQGAIRVDGGRLSQGSVIALYNLMSQILIELIKLANLIVTVTKACACGSRISAVLAMSPAIQITEDLKVREEEDVVVFDGVSMKYTENGDEALEGISFRVRAGETVGIIGGTGSGKSTLVQLIPHFYDVTAGEVRVNGKDVRDKGLQEYLRTRIGFVPQKATLFKGTVRENLLWGNPNATDEELWQALRLAQAETFIAEKQGLDTPVEQRGKNFSGGQKQRLTVARALVRNPDILILDDSSSALDYATDAELRKAVRGLNATTFIVAQRASSVLHADKIIVLDDGKAVGEGTHEQLLKTCAVYREIFQSQYEEDAV